jgi:hypothetical protein
MPSLAGQHRCGVVGRPSYGDATVPWHARTIGLNLRRSVVDLRDEVDEEFGEFEKDKELDEDCEDDLDEDDLDEDDLDEDDYDDLDDVL